MVVVEVVGALCSVFGVTKVNYPVEFVCVTWCPKFIPYSKKKSPLWVKVAKFYL